MNTTNNINNEIVICPECKGEGIQYCFNGDSNSKITCELCKGKRVVRQVTTVKYESV